MVKKNSYIVLFGFSGFCGLIYESIWSHYLKLFLGCAAYAQMLVLMIFMGGMAVGAFLAAQQISRIKNPLLWYASCEAVIGVLALLFHPFFVLVTDFSYDTIIPRVQLPFLLHIYKWTLAGLLILPQSVLLGTTFPLMSSGVMREFPERPGRTLALLYFINSLGGAAGVLVCGYVLIGVAGYPGTIISAGIVNLAIAAIVRALCGRESSTGLSPETVPAEQGSSALRKTLYGFLAVSAVTGASSFIYEIGWIRMLGLVVGTYTHAFELMLSAFILGLAIGSLCIRRKIDFLADRVLSLGVVQLAMGALALATIVLYNSTFDWMNSLYATLQQRGPETRYFLLQLSSQSIALIIMLPATICAGMTLPLITRHLLANGFGEKSIGAVYAANTLGAIAGVFFSMQAILPALGLKNLMIAGGAIDLALGVALLGSIKKRAAWALAAALFSLGIVCGIAFSGTFDVAKMSSLLFTDRTSTPADKTVIFHKDGKTASVDVIRYKQDSSIGISTNGMSVGFVGKGPNLITLNSTLLAALPVAMIKNPRTVATFGVGTGYNARVFLADPAIEQVDVIEIEKQMYEGARHIGDWVSQVYANPRCRRYVEDAKSFFSWKHAVYDIVVADISYVWVSGVAGLFSKEFYRLVRSHVSQDGLFVQWMHPTSMPLLASIIKALSENFRDYSIFNAGYFTIIVAGENASFERISDAPFKIPVFSGFLRDNGITAIEDFHRHYLGNKVSLSPLFESYAVPANSDFNPLLDLLAFKAMITGGEDSFDKLNELRNYSVPLIDILENRRCAGPSRHASDAANTRPRILFNFFTQGRPLPPAASKTGDFLAVLYEFPKRTGSEKSRAAPEISDAWANALEWLWDATMRHLTNDEMDTLLACIKSRADFSVLSLPAQQLHALFSAINRHDFQAVYDIAAVRLATVEKGKLAETSQLPAAMAAAIQLGKKELVQSMLKKYQVNDTGDIGLRLLYSKARHMVSNP